MNIPLGTPEKKFVELKYETILSDLKEFMEKKKTGYFAILVEGKHGFQEAFLAIDTGMIFASAFEYLKYGKVYKAGEALKRSLNTFFAEKGLYDVYVWNTQQVELFKVFNDDLILLENITPVKFSQIMPKSRENFEEEDLREFLVKEATREDLLKKYKMEEIKEEKPLEEQIVEDLEQGVIDEHKALQEMLEEYLNKSKEEKPKMTEETSKLNEEPPVGHGVEKFKELALKENRE